MARVVGRLPEPGEGSAAPEEFEAALAPMYAWLDQLANGRAAGGRWASGAATAKAWSLLSADGRAPLRGKALAALLPLGIAGINLAGLGPVQVADRLRRAAPRGHRRDGRRRAAARRRRPPRRSSATRTAPGRWPGWIPASGVVPGGDAARQHRLLDRRAAHQHRTTRASPTARATACSSRTRARRGSCGSPRTSASGPSTRSDARRRERSRREPAAAALRASPGAKQVAGSRARRAARVELARSDVALVLDDQVRAGAG